MSDWATVLLILCSGAAYLLGRWRGIKDFEKQMVERGLLPPKEEE
jgi:hypothetical protein